MNSRIGIALLGVAAFAILASGCGGGGSTTGTTNGGNGGNGGSNGTLVGVPSLMAYLGSSTTQTVHPSNLAVGDTIRLRVFGSDTQGRNVVANGSNWSTNAPSDVATVAADGTLRALAPTGWNSYVVTGSFDGQAVSSPLVITERLALVAGRVRNINNAGIAPVRVMFYNGAGSLLGQTFTGANGTFRANVPANASRMSVNLDQADPSGPNSIYHRIFEFGDNSFLADEASCRAPIPALTLGTTRNLSEIFIPARVSGPPPPPTGCLD